MLTISCNIIADTINNGLIILDEDLNIVTWNRWLEIRTDIKESQLLGKNICEEFSYINKKKLKRKIKSVFVTNNPAFYSVDPHRFLIKIKSNSIVEKVFDYMQQDVTIIPYDIEKKLVCIYIYDNTKFYETSSKLEELNVKLKDLSNRDPLTHAYNRRYFAEMSQKYLSLSKRHNHNISIIVLDIDNFKFINDSYGHAIGDDVIISLAKNLEKYVRSTDIVSRFGGEEFIILLYDISYTNSVKIAKKIRENIENIKLETVHGPLKYTVSIGVSMYDQIKDDSNIERTIIRADHALYIAKNSGKNQVQVSN